MFTDLMSLQAPAFVRKSLGPAQERRNARSHGENRASSCVIRSEGQIKGRSLLLSHPNGGLGVSQVH